MKKTLAFFVCALFVLSTASFALWGIGGKKSTETKVITSETKTKEVGKGKMLGIPKQETKGKKVLGKKVMPPKGLKVMPPKSKKKTNVIPAPKK
ncbi:MAG: hypothetical protein NT030_07110 [Candidatus Saganbacteria bacterium]|nr:hypothetical protein [Candidatus Saganbacteria bacterium]